MYDYFLGGYHNFEVDRMAAQKVIEANPETPLVMRVNRAFLRRTVNFLVGRGIDQFLDIGSGIPTVGNVHEVARRSNPDARVVYADIESVAVRHGEAILADDPNVSIIEADLRDPEATLQHPKTRELLDFSRPVAVLIISVLPFVIDEREAYESVKTLREAVAPGSYLVVSHATYEGAPPRLADRVNELYAKTANPVQMRSYTQVERFFDGFELVHPGLVYVPLWRPEGPEDLFLDSPERCSNYGGVALKR